MRLHRMLPIALIALGALSMGSGCPTMPKLEDRVVELAIGGSTTLPPFRSQSTVNVHYDTPGTYNLQTDIDLNQLLDDSSIDVSKTTGIILDKVWYRVSTANATARVISNGTVTVQQVGIDPAPVTLITGFTQDVGATTPFIRAPLTAAGVDVLNRVLGQILTATKNGTAVANPQVIYHVIGDADGVPYDFQWELRLDVTISGEIDEIQVLN